MLEGGLIYLSHLDDLADCDGVRAKSLPYADPFHLQTVVLSERVQHGVRGEQLGVGQAANLQSGRN